MFHIQLSQDGAWIFENVNVNHFNTNLQTAPTSSNYPFSLGALTKILHAFHIFPIHTICHDHLAILV